MRAVPKRIDANVKERGVRLVLGHLQKYPSLTAAAEAVVRREGVGKESVRRWVMQAQVDGGQRQGATSEHLAEIKQLEAKVCELAWTVDELGCRRLSPEGRSGRRKMSPLVRRSLRDASPGSVDRATRSLGLHGIRRSKGIRTTIPATHGRRAGDLLNRDLTALAPNRTWVMDFTYVRAWTGFVYVAFIVDVFAQRVVAWNAATATDTDLVMNPLRMAIWKRARDGHPIVPAELIGHADAGSQYTSTWFSGHLALEGVRPSIGSVGDAYDNALMRA